MRSSVYQLLANLRNPGNESIRVGLFREFDCSEKKKRGCGGASLRAFELSSLQESDFQLALSQTTARVLDSRNKIRSRGI